MKVLVISGSRADRNGLVAVYEALRKAGHEALMVRPWALAEGYDAATGSFDADVALLAGDRSEILAAALACAVRKLPIAHIAGGDRTLGSMDDRFRDAITALACIHCVTNARAFERLSNMRRESSDCVVQTGSPALDPIQTTPRMTETKVREALGVWPAVQIIVVSVHPNTVSADSLHECRVLMAALDNVAQSGAAFVCLGANGDLGGKGVNKELLKFCENRRGRGSFRDDLEPALYYSLLEHASCMVGNSSAGRYEAPLFGLPVVEVGNRQEGRLLPDNVTVVPVDPDAIAKAVIVAAQSRVKYPPCFVHPSLFGDGQSAPRIVKVLERNSWRWSKEGLTEAAKPLRSVSREAINSGSRSETWSGR